MGNNASSKDKAKDAKGNGKEKGSGKGKGQGKGKGKGKGQGDSSGKEQDRKASNMKEVNGDGDGSDTGDTNKQQQQQSRHVDKEEEEKENEKEKEKEKEKESNDKIPHPEELRSSNLSTPDKPRASSLKKEFSGSGARRTQTKQVSLASNTSIDNKSSSSSLRGNSSRSHSAGADIGRSASDSGSKSPRAQAQARSLSTWTSGSSLLSMPDMMQRLRSVIISRDENHALVFIKPHAVNKQMRSMLEEHFAAHNCYITSEGILKAEEMKARGIVDAHYSALAEKALETEPKDLPISDVQKQEFEAVFGKSWDECLTDGCVMNLAQLENRFEGVDPDQIERDWNQIKEIYKIAPGLYVGRLAALEDRPEAKGQPVLVVNGFYAGLRNQFLRKGAKVIYFTVEWKELDLSWSDFRTKVIGETDPKEALPSSLRGRLYEDYETFGLTEPPTKGNNGVHASAGPVEAMKERVTWLNRELHEDPFYLAMKAEGIHDSLIQQFYNNEVITVWGKTAPAFDLLEELDSSEVIEVAAELAGRRRSTKSTMKKSEFDDEEGEEDVRVVEDEEDPTQEV